MGYMHQRLLSAGHRKHKLILDQAIEMASTRGLQGVTFGRLADSLRMSKSGLFVHFGSKEELQLEAIDTMWKRFKRHIGFECMEVEPGAPLLRAKAKGWISFLSRRRTGAFLLSIGIEFDLAGRVRSNIEACARLWASSLEGEVQAGIERDHFKSHVTPQALAFEIHGIAHHSVWARRLLLREDAWVCARSRINRAIHRSCTQGGRIAIAEYLQLRRGIPLPLKPRSPQASREVGSDGGSTL